MCFLMHGKNFEAEVRMRILHTSDWHLGKRLMDRERLPEQIAVLDEITELCDARGVDVVLVAGDVFDTYLPPAEAEEAFFHAVKKLAGSDRAVVIVSGNHDDGIRLSASVPIAAEEGIYIFGARAQRIPVGGNRPVCVAEAGENYIVLRNQAGEHVYINALPYPNEARLREEKSEESYAEKTARWIAAGDERYDRVMPHILLTHLFVTGGSVSDSERDISLGGARLMPAENLPPFGYTALGHLHKRQKIGDFARYSGSILQYSFDEANTEKGVVLLETRPGGDVVVSEEIPLKAGMRLVRLEANGVEEGLRLLGMHENKYIELTLNLSEPLMSIETRTLREANKGLVSLITRVKEGQTASVVRRSELDAKQLFTEFYRMKCDGKEPSDDLKEAFLLLLEET